MISNCRPCLGIVNHHQPYLTTIKQQAALSITDYSLSITSLFLNNSWWWLTTIADHYYSWWWLTTMGIVINPQLTPSIHGVGWSYVFPRNSSKSQPILTSESPRESRVWLTVNQLKATKATNNNNNQQQCNQQQLVICCLFLFVNQRWPKTRKGKSD